MLGTTLSHYRILEELGKGGMGEVYLAEDTTLKRKVALKVLPPELASSTERLLRFQREAELLAGLNHPNIVTIHSVETVETPAEADGVREPDSSRTIRFLTMEAVEGETLAQVVAQGALPLERLFDIATQLADALATAHDKGVIHRDLKPANVMLTHEGRVKILDFGLAKLLEEEPLQEAAEGTAMATEPLTREGSTMGTVPYMSPEQLTGDTVDHRSDIFSLGVVLYEMATGRRPFVGDRPTDLVSSILRDRPLPVTTIRDELPRHLGRIISHSLEKAPDHRYQSALDVRNEITGLRQEVASGEHPGTALSGVSGRAEPARKRWMFAATAAGVIGLAGLSWYLVGDARAPEAPTTGAAEPAATAGRRMIVVLPFENLGEPDDEYFAAGVTDEISSHLASVSGIAVISRKSAIQYAGTDKTIEQIGRELGVQYVLEGTVRWARGADPSRVRITPQLIGVQDDTQLWSETYDRVIDDIFAVQSDIASRVIDQLGLTLLPRERESMAARPTDNLDAYQAYLRGLDQTGRLTYSSEARRLEIEMFERAVELDPQFAQAWAALSVAHSGLMNLGMDKSPERLVMAREAVDRALELEPDLPEAHLAMAYYYYWGRREYDAALEELAIAQRDIPDDPEVLIADFAIKRRQGRLDESLESIERAFELSPREDDLPREISVNHYMMGNYEDGLRSLDRSIALAPDQQAAYFFKIAGRWAMGQPEAANRDYEQMPKTPGPFLSFVELRQAWMNREWQRLIEVVADAPVAVAVAPDLWMPIQVPEAQARLRLGDTDRAQAALATAQAMAEQQLMLTPDDPRVHSALGLIFSLQGRKADAIREGKRAVELYPPARDALHGPRQVQALAEIYANVGEVALAVENLDLLLSGTLWGLSAALLEIDPTYDPIREEPEFLSLLEKYR